MNIRNKIFILVLAIFLSLSLVKIALACMTKDSKFILNIGHLHLDTEKLKQLCTLEKCTISRDYITIKSHYDERVAVIIGKIFRDRDFQGITVRLPYNLNEENYPIVSEINPEKYNWKESAAKDLNFLKEIGILEITNSNIEKISNLATNDKSIFYCKNRWELWDTSCTDCDGCTRCGGAPVLATSLPIEILGE